MGAYTVLSSALKNDALGTNQAYSNTFNHTFNRLVDTVSGGRWAGHGGVGATALNYRWTVSDRAGASAESQFTITPGNSTNIAPSFQWNSLSAPSLRTGVFGSTGAGGGATETELNREKGNTFVSNISFTVNRANQYIPLTGYILSVRRFFNGAYDSYTGITSGVLPNPATSTISGLTYRAPTTGASLDRLEFQAQITDDYWDSVLSGSPVTTTYTVPTTRVINFNYMMFYGATTNQPLNGTMIRGLSSGLVIAPDPSVGPPYGEGGNNSASGTVSNPLNGIIGPAGANTYFICAVPDGLSATFFDQGLQQVVNFSFGGEPNTTIVAVPDASGVNKNYNVYIQNAAVPFGDARHWNVTTTGTVTQP